MEGNVKGNPTFGSSTFREIGNLIYGSTISDTWGSAIIGKPSFD